MARFASTPRLAPETSLKTRADEALREIWPRNRNSSPKSDMESPGDGPFRGNALSKHKSKKMLRGLTPPETKDWCFLGGPNAGKRSTGGVREVGLRDQLDGSGDPLGKAGVPVCCVPLHKCLYSLLRIKDSVALA